MMANRSCAAEVPVWPTPRPMPKSPQNQSSSGATPVVTSFCQVAFGTSVVPLLIFSAVRIAATLAVPTFSVMGEPSGSAAWKETDSPTTVAS